MMSTPPVAAPVNVPERAAGFEAVPAGDSTIRIAWPFEPPPLTAAVFAERGAAPLVPVKRAGVDDEPPVAGAAGVLNGLAGATPLLSPLLSGEPPG